MTRVILSGGPLGGYVVDDVAWDEGTELEFDFEGLRLRYVRRGDVALFAGEAPR